MWDQVRQAHMKSISVVTLKAKFFGKFIGINFIFYIFSFSAALLSNFVFITK